MAILRKVLVLFLLAALAAGAAAQAKPRLAILPFTGGSGGDGETIALLLGNQSEIRAVFTAVPRTSNIDAIMKEQQFQRSGLTDSDTIAALGKQMNADFVVAGHITRLGDRNLVLITIVNVESFQQIAGVYREYKEIGEIRGYLPEMAKKLGAASRVDTSRLPKLAVLPFAIPAGVNAQDAEVLAQLLATEVANSGKYAVLPRTKTIETVMTEQKIQRTGLTDPDTVKAIGRATNARYVLSGNVLKLGANMNLFLVQILNIEDASLLAGGDVEYTAMADGLKLMPELSAALTGVQAGTGAAVPQGLVFVEGGSFQMGGSGEYDGRPIHTVTVRSFYMGKYEVTQKEWIAVMGTNPSNFKGDNLPVENLSWFEAVEYCNKLSLKEGLTPAYRGSGDGISCNFTANGYRLPTEAEWEYAAKGGNKDLMTYDYSGGNNAGSVGWYGDNSGNRTHEVGTKAANSLGIYDMSGNVWEWCWDWYGNYSSGAQTDPVGASSGTNRVCRGGSWDFSAQFLRSAYRFIFTPSYRHNFLGFRLVRPSL